MVNVWLIIVAIVVSFMMLASSIYFLVYFQSPEDKNQAWLPKIVVVLGLLLAMTVVLLLPLDVANKNTGGLRVDGLWMGVLMAVAGMVFIVIPFFIFYYEEDDPDTGVGAQLKSAIALTIMMVIVVALTVGLLYAFLGYSLIPYDRYSAKLSDTIGECVSGGSGGCGGTEKSLKIRVSIVVYIIAMTAFVGWFLFALFGGIGVVALPMDLINAFRTRPEPLEPSERARIKLELQQRATRLVEAGRELQDRKRRGEGKGRKYKKAFLAYKQSVYFLERDFEKLRILVEDKGGSPIKWWFFLFLGLAGIVISIAWMLHIILFVFIQPPASPFLNVMFVDLDNFFPLFGTVMYGIFAFYLLWAVIKGNVKFGLRILCIAIHPMKIGDTLMNSFLFNIILILFCAVAVTQFCAQAFSQYARLTAAGSLFGVYIRYLIYIKYFWIYILYAFFGLSFLTLVYLVFFPKDKSKEKEVDMELIALRGGVH